MCKAIVALKHLVTTKQSYFWLLHSVGSTYTWNAAATMGSPVSRLVLSLKFRHAWTLFAVAAQVNWLN